jgi:osmotically-inducible protein OsmY
MEIVCATPVGLCRTGVAAAIALVLCSPVYAADPEPTMTRYDSAVTYADYRDQQGSYKLRASDLVGRDIHNANNDEIGEIDDLVLSRDGDKVMAILSLGGLDRGSKLVAIPYQDLRVTQNGEHVYYNATQDELQGRSEFTYADGEHPVQAESIDDTLAAVDGRKSHNSTHTARDVAGDALMPLDPSHAEADVDITRSIRKALVDDDTLGTNAQNLKVITIDGMVTLRGAVASADEQARIEAIANEAVGRDRVLNELQVIKR